MLVARISDVVFEELVKLMVEHDMQKVSREREEEYVPRNLAEFLERGVKK